MSRKFQNLNQTKIICLAVLLLTITVTATIGIASLVIPVNGQTMQEKCTPDQTGINVSKSNCFSDIPTSVGDNMTINGTTGQ